MSYILGIDLGTTNSVMAVCVGDAPKIIENSEGVRTTPSYYAETQTGFLTGMPAKRQAVTNPDYTYYAVKRLIGAQYDADTKQSYATASGPDGMAVINGRRGPLTPEYISAQILIKLKADAEASLGEPVTQAVITVPAYFNNAQREATKEAGRMAGLEVMQIINEPTAAALAYGHGKGAAKTIAVYDLGGGTFDCTILAVSGSVFEVLATSGIDRLGGEDFDLRIVEHLADEFQQLQGIDLRLDRMAYQRLKEEAERAKKELSTVKKYEISLPFITADKSGPKHLSGVLTRAKLESLVMDLIEQTQAPCRHALSDAGLMAQDIDDVVLVGGMTRMPAVQKNVIDIFGKASHSGVNPDEAIALGAAIQAGVLSGDVGNAILLDVASQSLGIETEGGVFHKLIERNTAIPFKSMQIFTTAADNQPAVTVQVYQGESDHTDQNHCLGEFTLDGILPAPACVPQIAVSFEIDVSGIVTVHAMDAETGRQEKIHIKR